MYCTDLHNDLEGQLEEQAEQTSEMQIQNTAAPAENLETGVALRAAQEELREVRCIRSTARTAQ